LKATVDGNTSSFIGDVSITGALTADTVNGSQTITHETISINQLTLGTFCETSGEIFYMKPRFETKRTPRMIEVTDEETGEVFQQKEVEFTQEPIPWNPYEDCICKIKQSTELNKNIVGVITHIDGNKCRFATHGDCLIKVVNGSYNLGDVIIPTTGGLGKKGIDQEIMTCLVQGIPKLKVTSLNTNIPNTLAGLFF
jgi:hypothetical protein